MCCLLCGCGTDSGRDLNGEENAVFSYGVDYTLESLDPFHNSNNNVRTLSDAMHGFLLWWDTDNEELEGELAREWHWVSEMELVIFLNQGFRFSNGENVTADDVVYTFERILDPQWGSFRYSVFSQYLDRVEAQDTYTVRFRMKRTDSIFLMRLTQIPIICRQAVDTLGTEPVGCGPFSFVSWGTDGELTMERSKHYPRSGARYASFSGLVIKSYSSREALLKAFADEEIDSMEIQPSELLSVTGSSDAYIQGGLGNSYYLAGNQDNEILSTWGVMQAIKYAIDREEILNLTQYGFGNITLAPLPVDSPFYPGEYEYERDLTIAAEWLKVAGYSEGFSIELTVMDRSNMLAMAQLLKTQLSEIGIDIRIRRVSIEDFPEIWAQEDFELTIYNTAISREPAEKYQQWKSTGLTNYVNYRNLMFDHLLEVGSTTLDSGKQEKYYDWMQRIFQRDAVVQYLVNHHIFYAVHQGWTGLESHFMITDFTALRPAGEGGR